MRSSRTNLAFAAAAIALCMTAMSTMAATWRGATDASGFTWARIKFINLSDQPSNWSVNHCRTATGSGANTAVIDTATDWDGVVDAGSAVYVWIYGMIGGDIAIINADGGASAFGTSALPLDGGDSEVVITIANDGTVSAALEPAEAYGVPSYTGNLPALE